MTEKGRALVPVIESMRQYGLVWLCGETEHAAEAELSATLAEAPVL